jgi:hypothetical protein
MAKKRVPKVGDRVDAIGHHGAFVVSEINAKRQTAKLTRLLLRTRPFDLN